MWILRALAQFKGSERSPGLSLDSEDDIWKFKAPHHTFMNLGSQSEGTQFETYG